MIKSKGIYETSKLGYREATQVLKFGTHEEHILVYFQKKLAEREKIYIEIIIKGYN